MRNIVVPKEIDYLIKKEKRKDTKKRIINVYEALLYKRDTNKSWFPVPSSYLRKISFRYYQVINSFIENGIIEYYSTDKGYSKDLFDSKIYDKKNYNKVSGKCMKYRFLIDTENGYNYTFDDDFPNIYDTESWYLRTKYSLLQSGFNIEDLFIRRDNFSRRLHTNITGCMSDSQSYKTYFSGGNYFSIDSKTSQPRLLWMHLNKIGLYDKNFSYIFESGLDFYDYIIERIEAINSREEAKELFTSWVNGTGYLETEKSSIRNIFPIVNTFLRNFKSSSYKDICRLLQKEESEIFIDDLLNNVPVKFCLSVHDSLIVKKEDVDIVLNFCRQKYPELIFIVEEIKYKI